MESVVAEAYIKLLLSLQQMQQDGSLVNYSFHSLWPVSLNEINPWEYLVSNLYMEIFSSKHSLFYSEVMGCWKKLNECNFLSKSILQIGFNNDLFESIYRVAASLNLPVVHLPDKLLDKHKDNSYFSARIIDETEFVKHFFQDETLLMVNLEDKTEIVAASLMVFANNRHTKVMPALMRNTKCIPCSPDGKAFKTPQELLDPNSQIAQLFSPEDGVFPDQHFLSRNQLLVISLKRLGLMESLSWEMLIGRARCVEEWYSENAQEALKRLVIILECIKDNSSVDLPQKSAICELHQIRFLPTLKRPDIYPIKWKADTMPHLLAGPELLRPFYGENNINAVYACGSQVAILDTYSLSTHLTPIVRKILGVPQEIEIIHVVCHFSEWLQWFQDISSDSLSKDLIENTNNVALTVYRFLNTKLKSIKDDDCLLTHLLSLRDKPCIWNGKRFLTPSCVCYSWEMSGPYLYQFPEILEPFFDLMNHLGIEDDFSAVVLLNALHEMKSKYGNNKLKKNARAVVMLILPKLLEHEIPSGTDIVLPDHEFVLRSAKELKYNDAPWLPSDKKYIYCNECVQRSVAIHLDIKLIKNILLEDLDITSNEILLLGQEFGQQEKLTQRLNNILRDYPRDITFLKELLQNADDAGASKLYIILDKRSHDNEKVISEGWKTLQGPALLFWNDSSFTDEDLVGIQKIGLGSKRDDPDKIGQYGIGFNVVYHFTDCPSFVTNDQLCILDPHYRYIAQKRMKPGWMFQGLEQLWNSFSRYEITISPK